MGLQRDGGGTASQALRRSQAAVAVGGDQPLAACGLAEWTC